MTKQKQNIRDELRARTLGSKKVFKSKIIKHNGQKYELRQPTLAQRSELRKRVLDDEGNFDIFESLIWMVVFYTYVPDTDELVFEEADYDILRSFPSGSWVDEFSDAAASLININAKEIAKNLEETANDSGSSPSQKS